MDKKQNQLIKNLEKKCTTIMIGSLVRFEQKFGYLWNSEDEAGDRYYDMWQDVRRDILNFGNHHTRDVVENIYKFFIDDKNEKSNYYEFRFNKQQGDKDEN